MNERHNATVLKRNVGLLLLVGASMVVFTHVSEFFFDYGTWKAWWFANVLHVTGGCFAFFFTRAVFLYTASYHKTKTVWWMELLIFIAGALTLGVVWEWYELALDRYHVLVIGRQSLMTYADNIGDLASDTFGALIGAYILTSYGKRK